MMLRSISLGAGLAALAVTTAVHAESEALEDSGNTITVTATKEPMAIVDAPATVSVITDLEIDDTLVEDIKDLVRFEPGVSVRSQPSRFSAALAFTGRDGNTGFNIRGLEGNRVLIQTDGIRLPEGFSFGAQSVGRGDYADLDLVKSVEILRGPASALYGSDGLAGAVSFITKDPSDFLEDGKNYGGRLRLGYSGADEGWAKGAVVAARLGGDVSILAAYTRRDTGPQENQGRNNEANTRRTTPNPQENDSNALLGKLVWDPGNGHRVRLTGEYQSRDSRTEVLSARAIPPVASPTGTLDLDAFDRLTRGRASLDWRYTGEGLVESAYAVAYHQKSKTRQYSAEDRNISADRIRDNSFNNRVTGLSFETRLAFGGDDGFDNRLLVGGDYSVTRQTGVRDGTVPPAGETFPIRAFPVTDYTLLGLFIQDTIDIGNGKLLIYPGIRFDHYKLDPKPDATFPGIASKQSDEHFSPKLGVVGWVSDVFGLFAGYAQGFRSPTPSQVNNGFANPIQNYVSIANPDLKPETSRAFEGGLRIRNADIGGVKLLGSLTAYTSRYKNFIEQAQISGNFAPPPAPPTVFQYVNRGRVKVSGVEGRFDAEFGGGLGASFSAAYADGKARSGGVSSPLSSIDPVKLVAGLRYREPENRFGGQLIVTHSAGKKQKDIGETCSPRCYNASGFTIVDATAFVTVSDAATLRVGVFNLLDKKYSWWADVRGLALSPVAGTNPVQYADPATADAYTQPGRNVSASLTLKF